jgi:hypothetical protein
MNNIQEIAAQARKDKRKRTFKRGWGMLLAFLLSPFFANGQPFDVNLSSLLDEMISYEAAALYPNYVCRQQSSYDRRSVAPGAANWFANDDGSGFIRTETTDGRTEKVLFEDSGPGAITRIWMTTVDRRGTLRFYFDHATTANWTIPAYDMTQAGLGLGLGLCQPHINNEAGGKGGSSFFLPIPYAEACKVTLEEPSPTFSTPRYHQFNYRKYPAGTRVETFATSVVAALAAQIAAVDQSLLHPPAFDGGTPVAVSGQAAADDSLCITLPSGTNMVRTLQIVVDNYEPETYPQLMRGLVLKAVFDGKQTVWAPLSDFAGGGMGAPPVESWYVSADGKGTLTSRWAMPYRESGEIRIVNYSGQAVAVSVQARTAAYAWQENRSLYFHASWRQQVEIPLTQQWEKCIDWNFASLTGRGVYRGDVLTLFNYSPRWYGEGDEKIFVDNEPFPSHFGTGTEDYYNCSWAPVRPFQTPFGGAPRADRESSNGYNTFFRTRNLDAIPFADRLKFDIEMLSWDAGVADYATTVFWYGDATAFAVGTSGEEEATRPLPPEPQSPDDYTIPNAMEWEDLTPVEQSPGIRSEVQVMTPFQGKWSKARQLLCRNAQVGDYLRYRLEGYDPAKHYRIQIQGTRAVDYGILSFVVNGERPRSVDFYHDGVVHTGVITLASRLAPVDGAFELKVTYAGRNAAATGNLIGLDCIQIIEADFVVDKAVELETHEPAALSGFTNHFAQELTSWCLNGKWSHKKQQVFQGGKKGDYIDYRFAVANAEKKYKLTLYATRGPDFAILSFAVNGEALPIRYDGFHELIHDSGPIELGVFSASADGVIALRVVVAGTNPYSLAPHYIVGLDCLLLEEQAPLSLRSDRDAAAATASVSIAGRQLSVEGPGIVTVGLYAATGSLIARRAGKPFAFAVNCPGFYLAVISYKNKPTEIIKIRI